MDPSPSHSQPGLSVTENTQCSLWPGESRELAGIKLREVKTCRNQDLNTNIRTSENPQNMAPMGKRYFFIHCPKFLTLKNLGKILSFKLRVCVYVMFGTHVPDKGPNAGTSRMAAYMVTPLHRNGPPDSLSLLLNTLFLTLKHFALLISSS